MAHHILLADDDPALRRFLTASLTQAGFTVTPCADGLEAQHHLSHTHIVYDLLLTDIVMPGIDGIELSNYAREKFPAIHVIFMTGFGTIVQDSLESPTTPQVLAKPLHLGSVVAEVQRLLGITPI
jgi:two-component system, cell cycle response regulator CpdR